MVDERLRIVVADDHPSIRENLRALLNAEADLAVVAVAKNGDEALRLTRQHDADVLVVDGDMPGADGLAVTRALRSLKARTRIVLYTMRSELCDLGYPAGVAACVTKDAPYELLVDAVRAAGIYLLDHRKAKAKPEVLVVEDDDVSRDMLVTGLSEVGFQVRSAPNGERALAQCADHDPDVILLDLLMPVMGGREFLRAYRSGGRGRARILTMSALTRSPEIARELGCDASVMKPFDFSELIGKVFALTQTPAPIAS
jgi:CheY-like chemotaxis protein